MIVSKLFYNHRCLLLIQMVIINAHASRCRHNKECCDRKHHVRSLSRCVCNTRSASKQHQNAQQTWQHDQRGIDDEGWLVKCVVGDWSPDQRHDAAISDMRHVLVQICEKQNHKSDVSQCKYFADTIIRIISSRKVKR